MPKSLCPIAQYLTAVLQGVGVVNAGIFYMGLLANPAASWSMGFKSTFDYPELRSLALRMEKWCDLRALPIRTLALQFGLRHDAVSTTTISCRTAV